MYTPESYHERRTAAENDAAEADAWLSVGSTPTRTPDELRARRIGDAERAANAILARGSTGFNTYVTNAVVERYVVRVAEDPLYVLDFFDFCRGKGSPEDAEWVAGVGSMGYIIDPSIFYEHLDIGDVLFNPGDVEMSPRLRQRFGYIDMAFLQLAGDVVRHRSSGEEGIEQTTQLYGTGMMEVSSLAAQLADFAMRLVRAASNWAAEDED